MRELPREELHEIFDHFDRNGDGKIDRDEFVELMKALDAFETDRDANLGFKAIDLDGSGVVEFDEFARWYSSR